MTGHGLKVGDLVTFPYSVRVPLKWWQKPFARWIKPQYVERDVEFKIVSVTSDTFHYGERK